LPADEYIVPYIIALLPVNNPSLDTTKVLGVSTVQYVELGGA
jgi:hypothetical protein